MIDLGRNNNEPGLVEIDANETHKILGKQTSQSGHLESVPQVSALGY